MEAPLLPPAWGQAVMSYSARNLAAHRARADSTLLATLRFREDIEKTNNGRDNVLLFQDGL